MTTAVVTGANSGLGRAASIHLAARGWRVYGTMRDLSRGDKLAALCGEAGVEVHPVVCDVTDDSSVRSAFEEVIERAGEIDVLVNNAGIGGNGSVEESTVDDYRAVVDVNVYGAIRCIQAVLPGMRQRRSGAIVNVTSVAGRVALLGQSPYIVSKWGLEALSESLAQEVAPHGIRVIIIEPGVFKTAIMAKTTEVPGHTGAYESVYRRMFAMYTAALRSPQLTDPSEMGAVIAEAVETDRPKLRWSFGWGARGLIEGRAELGDEDWVSMTATEDDSEYSHRFQAAYGLDIHAGFDS